MQQLDWLTTPPDSHHQGIGHELRGHARLHRPANDATRVQVEHHGHVQPAFGSPEVGEVGHPLLVWCVCLELAVEHVACDGAALAAVGREPTTPWSGAQRLRPHESLDTVQAAAVTQCQYVMPDAARAVGTVAAQKTVMDLTAHDLVVETALASGPVQPCLETTSRDTECLAHEQYRPGPSVFRHEAELHIDSLAK